MNFIAKKTRWIGLLLLVGFTTVAAGLYFDAPARLHKAKSLSEKSAIGVRPSSGAATSAVQTGWQHTETRSPAQAAVAEDGHTPHFQTGSKPIATTAMAKYACPMHPDVVSEKPSDCPKCGMALVTIKPVGGPGAESVHAGCGVMEASESHGCCGSRESAQLALPPGHPPIPGYAVQSGCSHGGPATTNSSHANPL